MTQDSDSADSHEGAVPRRASTRRHRRRWPWAVVVGVLLVGMLGVAGWLGSRVLIVKNELEASRDAVASIQAGGEVRAGMEGVATHSGRALAATDDPIWKAAEYLPWAGDNLRAARIASQSLRFLSADLVIPVMAAFDEDSTIPVLGRVVPVLQAAAPQASQLAAELSELEQSTALVEQVRGGVEQASQVMAAAAPALQLMPGMLGGEGSRNYLLVGQSNAETLALGGSAASQTLIKIAENGKIKVAAQADSSDFRFGEPVDVPVDQSALDLFGEYLNTRSNTTVDRPDFPTAASLIKAFWQRDIRDDRIDGVISADPIALSHVLDATGPVKVAGIKEEVNSENAVRLLLSDAYALSEDPNVADEFFKSVALTVLDKVTNGQFEVKPMITAIQESIDGGNLLFWSADDEIQSKLATMRIGGVLPKNNDDQSTVGVFLRDGSMGSKIDYYMKSWANVDATCSADGRTVFTTKVKLKLDLSQEQADSLPAYVISQKWGSKQFRTQVFIYGPPGTEVSDVTLEKGDWKWRPAKGTTDLGRPVASFMTYQKPGESSTVTAVFEGAGDFGPLAVRTTPMVSPTEVTLADGRCGAK